MVKRLYPKPGEVGRPRLCQAVIKAIRELRGEGLSYSWIAYELSVHPDTARAYCTGKWKDYVSPDMGT